MDKKDLAHFATITGRAEFCAWLGINPRTLKRWETGAQPIPRPVELLIQLRLDCDLSALGDEWRGFTINGGKLWAPWHRRGFTPAQIVLTFFELGELHSLRVQVRTLSAKLDALQREKAQQWACDKVRSLSAHRVSR